MLLVASPACCLLVVASLYMFERKIFFPRYLLSKQRGTYFPFSVIYLFRKNGKCSDLVIFLLGLLDSCIHLSFFFIFLFSLLCTSEILAVVLVRVGQ